MEDKDSFFWPHPKPLSDLTPNPLSEGEGVHSVAGFR
jgi:hypothetical protein